MVLVHSAFTHSQAEKQNRENRIKNACLLNSHSNIAASNDKRPLFVQISATPSTSLVSTSLPIQCLRPTNFFFSRGIFLNSFLRDQTLITQLAFRVVHELMILSDYAPALSAHKESPSGFAYFCPRNRKGVSADVNKPKSVVRKLRNEVIDRCSDIRPNLFGGFALGPLLPFLPLIKEMGAKEDQGDDSHPSFQIEERRSLIHDLE